MIFNAKIYVNFSHSIPLLWCQNPLFGVFMKSMSANVMVC